MTINADEKYLRFLDAHAERGVSPRGEKMVRGVVSTARDREKYGLGTGTGLHQREWAYQALCQRLRLRKRALLRYAVRELGAGAKETARWCRTLGQQTTMNTVGRVFGVEKQCLRWLEDLERRASRPA